jgi:hypothetical protein
MVPLRLAVGLFESEGSGPFRGEDRSRRSRALSEPGTASEIGGAAGGDDLLTARSNGYPAGLHLVREITTLVELLREVQLVLTSGFLRPVRKGRSAVSISTAGRG